MKLPIQEEINMEKRREEKVGGEERETIEYDKEAWPWYVLCISVDYLLNRLHT